VKRENRGFGANKALKEKEALRGNRGRKASEA
jgi:hypothetical protein